MTSLSQDYRNSNKIEYRSLTEENFNKDKRDSTKILKRIFTDNEAIFEQIDGLYLNLHKDQNFIDFELNTKKCSLLRRFRQALVSSDKILQKIDNLAHKPFEECKAVMCQTTKDNIWNDHADNTNKAYLSAKAELTSLIKKSEELRNHLQKKSKNEDRRFIKSYESERQEVEYLTFNSRLLQTKSVKLYEVLQTVINKAQQTKSFMEKDKRNFQKLSGLNLKKVDLMVSLIKNRIHQTKLIVLKMKDRFQAPDYY